MNTKLEKNIPILKYKNLTLSVIGVCDTLIFLM